MKAREYFVYIMSSRSGTLYIGITNSIYRRALQHKAGEIEGFASKNPRWEDLAEKWGAQMAFAGESIKNR